MRRDAIREADYGLHEPGIRQRLALLPLELHAQGLAGLNETSKLFRSHRRAKSRSRDNGVAGGKGSMRLLCYTQHHKL